MKLFDKNLLQHYWKFSDNDNYWHQHELWQHHSILDHDIAKENWFRRDKNEFKILQKLISFLLIHEDQFPTNNELLLVHPNLIVHQKSMRIKS